MTSHVTLWRYNMFLTIFYYNNDTYLIEKSILLKQNFILYFGLIDYYYLYVVIINELNIYF